MPQIRTFSQLFLILACFLAPAMATAQTNEQNLDYILKRYSESNGGRAAMEQIISVRLRGKMVYPNGSESNITVLKKKPNLVRMTMDTGTLRIVQAYNGRTAWYSRQQGRQSIVQKLDSEQAAEVIRDAPLENVLLNNSQGQAKLSLGPEKDFDSMTCYQIIASFPDGSQVHHYIDQEEFLERRIIQFDAEGRQLAEIIPSDFEKTDGIIFSMKIDRLVDGISRGTLVLEEIETNIGILDGAFDPPVDLPED